MKYILFALFCLTSCLCIAQENLKLVVSGPSGNKTILDTNVILEPGSFNREVPLPQDVSKTATPVPDDLKDLVWNKWDTDNFIILSIDKNQGNHIKNNIEQIKTWLITRWGLPDLKFQGETKIVCVTNKSLLKRIFRLDEPKYNIQKNEDGSIKSCAVWFSLEDLENMPLKELSKLCIDQVESHYNKKFPVFCKNGMNFLNQDLRQIKNSILENPIDKISIKEIFDDKSNKEIESGVVCLLLRKEFGENNFLNYLMSKDIGYFGFKDNEKIEETTNRYYKNLFEDLKNKKVPDDYLKINKRR